jgi:peptidoglycan/xylan/chitin deacetylase (PgdA/CDA1 family)/SAM-dependent methyltransferase
MNLMRTALQMRDAPIIWVFHDVTNAEWFERCIDEISSARTVLPLVELADHREYENACAITFDDGLRSVIEVADPVLVARGLPYTVFVCTDVVTGGPVPWFWRVSHLSGQVGLVPVKTRWEAVGRRVETVDEAIIALKQVPLDSILEGLDDLEAQYAISPPDPRRLFLFEDEVKMLAARGATIGSHTHRHPILSRLTVEEQAFEIDESAKLIETVTGRRPREFAYPNGTSLDFNASTMAVLRASDFRVAVTTTPGHLRRSDDVLALPRVGLSDGDSIVRRAVKTLTPSLTMTHIRERALRSPPGVGRVSMLSRRPKAGLRVRNQQPSGPAMYSVRTLPFRRPFRGVRIATTLMKSFETMPPEPSAVAVEGINEVFRHPSFTGGSKVERMRIMMASARGIYEDERRYPWDNYFGRDLTPLLAGKHALDLGCFTGGRAVAWFERYGLASVFGIDTEDVFIEAAEAFARERKARAGFAIGRGERLSMGDATFDVILSFDVFEHVQDPALVLAECRRVLKSGGRAFVVFPGFFHPFEHHLSQVTTAPFIHYLFKPRTLLDAYCAILDDRGAAAAWYSRQPRPLQPWERGNTINGLTVRRFRRLASEAGLVVEQQVRKPLGSIGRRSSSSRLYHLVATVLRPLAHLPLVEEAVLHRGIFILRKP